MAVKKTRKEYFGELREIAVSIDRTDLVEFIDRQIELLDKKSKTKTKTQIENENFKNEIVETLTEIDKPITISELQELNSDLVMSNQKMTALLTQLVASNVVKRRVERQDKKRKVFFSINKD